MFHFPAFPPTHYEFTRRRPDTTLARFPHSDILGSTLACQLPEAYRRLQRPSSALHTKASTERPKTPTKQKTHPHQPQDGLKRQRATHNNHTGLLKMRACKDAHVHYTKTKHHTNTPTTPTSPQHHNHTRPQHHKLFTSVSSRAARA